MLLVRIIHKLIIEKLRLIYNPAATGPLSVSRQEGRQAWAGVCFHRGTLARWSPADVSLQCIIVLSLQQLNAHTNTAEHTNSEQKGFKQEIRCDGLCVVCQAEISVCECTAGFSVQWLLRTQAQPDYATPSTPSYKPSKPCTKAKYSGRHIRHARIHQPTAATRSYRISSDR